MLKIFLFLILFSTLNSKTIELEPIEVVGYNIPKKAVNVSFGIGSNIYFLFISPTCKHCVDLINKVKKYDMSKYTFNIILVDLIDKDFAAIELILNGKHGSKYDLISESLNSNYKYILRNNLSPKTLKIIEYNNSLFKRFEFNSVPVIISENTGLRVYNIK